MFWELVLTDVIGQPAELSCANVECEWRRRKHKMEKASRRPWTEFECSPRSIQLREYALREFWGIFVDDKPFCRDACFKHANVQPKAVLSCALTIMDPIYGWEDEEKRVGSKFATCMWIYTKEVLTRGQIFNPEKDEYLKKRMMSVMFCTNWVCTGAFEDHEWVSASTITDGNGTGLRNLCSVCGTMVHVVVFSTYKVEWNLGKTRF